MDINTFQLKMLGKSLLKLTLIVMAASTFIDKTGFFETLMKKYLLKAPKSLITFAVAFMRIEPELDVEDELELDVQGMYVTPGLVDAHTHLGLKADSEGPL